MPAPPGNQTSVNVGGSCESGGGAMLLGSTIKTGDGSNIYFGMGSEKFESLRHLRQLDPRADKLRIEDQKGKILPGSYDWVLEDPSYAGWLEGTTESLLWLKGDPGKGKTMLMIGLIAEIERYQGTLAYFFCQNGDNLRADATSVLRGLLFMLLSQRIDLLEHLDKEYKISGAAPFKASDTTLFYTLKQVFLNLLSDPRLGPIYLMIDALDECDQNLEILLNFIVESSSSNNAVRWVVSSRKSHDIPDILEGRSAEIDLEANGKTVEEIVWRFIDRSVEILAKNKKYTPNLQKKVLAYLKENAQGTFLWVHLVCKQLKTIERFQVLAKLEQFPAGLASFYKRMIHQISAAEDKEASGICFQILATVLETAHPLQLTTLARFVEIPGVDSSEGPDEAEDFDEVVDYVRELVGRCGSFLTIQNQTVYFIHQSAKDFLSRKDSTINFPIDPQDTHYRIATRCLLTLCTKLKKDILNLRLPGFETSDIPIEKLESIQDIRYACAFWTLHISSWMGPGKVPQSEEKCINLVRLVERFMSNNLLHYLEISSIFQNIWWASQIAQAFDRHLLDLFTSFRNKSIDETENQYLSLGLARDLKKFISNYRSPMEQFPLQVYVLLMFCPKNSLIRRHYVESIPRWINFTHKTRKSQIDWDESEVLTSGSGNIRFQDAIFTGGPNGLVIAAGIDYTSSSFVLLIWQRPFNNLVKKFTESLDLQLNVSILREIKLALEYSPQLGIVVVASRLWIRFYEAKAQGRCLGTILHDDSADGGFDRIRLSPQEPTVFIGHTAMRLYRFEFDISEPKMEVLFALPYKYREMLIRDPRRILESFVTDSGEIFVVTNEGLVYERISVKKLVPGRTDISGHWIVSERGLVPPSTDLHDGIWSYSATCLISNTNTGLKLYLNRKLDRYKLNGKVQTYVYDLTSDSTTPPHMFLTTIENCWKSDVRVSPSGQLNAFFCDKYNFSVDVVDQNGRLQQTLTGHTGILTSVRFSPIDDSDIISCSDDGTIRLWRLHHGADDPISRFDNIYDIRLERHDVDEEVWPIHACTNASLVVWPSMDSKSVITVSMPWPAPWPAPWLYERYSRTNTQPELPCLIGFWEKTTMTLQKTVAIEDHFFGTDVRAFEPYPIIRDGAIRDIFFLDQTRRLMKTTESDRCVRVNLDSSEARIVTLVLPAHMNNLAIDPDGRWILCIATQKYYPNQIPADGEAFALWDIETGGYKELSNLSRRWSTKNLGLMKLLFCDSKICVIRGGDSLVVHRLDRDETHVYYGSRYELSNGSEISGMQWVLVSRDGRYLYQCSRYRGQTLQNESQHFRINIFDLSSGELIRIIKLSGGEHPPLRNGIDLKLSACGRFITTRYNNIWLGNNRKEEEEETITEPDTIYRLLAFNDAAKLTSSNMGMIIFLPHQFRKDTSALIESYTVQSPDNFTVFKALDFVISITVDFAILREEVGDAADDYQHIRRLENLQSITWVEPPAEIGILVSDTGCATIEEATERSLEAMKEVVEKHVI